MSLTEQRVVVCHIGVTPKELKQVFSNSSFQLNELKLSDAIKNNRLRTVITSFANPRELSLLSEALVKILDNGVQLIIVDNDKYARAGTMFGPESLVRILKITLKDAQELPIKLVNGNTKNWSNRVLALCHEHNSPISKVWNDTKVNLKKEATLTFDQENIIKRAFEDFKEISVSPLYGGFSTAQGVWRVSAKAETRYIDYVVKLDTFTNTKKEIDTIRDMCVEQMAFPHYPPIMRDRCLSSARSRAFVTCFVDRSVLFEDYIMVNSSKLAVVSIFDGPLRLWRQNQTLELMPFGKYAVKDIFGKSTTDPNLIMSYQAAKKFDVAVLSPSRIIAKLKSVKKVSITKVMSHGDLHLRNIFIRHHSPDVVLIDFAKCSVLPATLDPAILDISLGFDIPTKDPQKCLFDRDTCIRVYAPPLLGRPVYINSDIESPRAEAIEAVRSHAITLCQELEYQVTVAASLLWRAAKSTDECAYTCASNIAKVL